MQVEQFKVRYGTTSAYLDTVLLDGTYTGTNKHTNLPVHLRWDGERWVEVCVRTFELVDSYNETWREVGVPDCACVGST